jgi:hypothetical protein
MTHIRNRNDLFRVLEENPPYKMGQILTALDTGKAELLGGFERIPPSDKPGWIIIVTSKRGTVWNVVVTAHENPPRFTTWIVQRIPWEHWAGKLDRDPTIYDGDHPVEYERRKLKARTMNE